MCYNSTVSENRRIFQMNLSDGGKNRRQMRGIGFQGLRSVLMNIDKWHNGMHLPEARAALWRWPPVTEQMTRLEKLCHDHKIILLYQSKSHPPFNLTEVNIICAIIIMIISNNPCLQYWWRKSKRKLLNSFSLAEIRATYTALQEQYRSGSEAAKTQFAKWRARVEIFASYYARGGEGYLRDFEIDNLDMTHLKRKWPVTPITSFEQLSRRAHELNWMVFRGKHLED